MRKGIVGGKGNESQWPGFESWLCLFFSCVTWGKSLSYQHLSCFISKMGEVAFMPHVSCMRVLGDDG